MNTAQKTHLLKVIKEAFKNQIVFIEHLPKTEIYLTANKLEIPETIRELFFQNALIFENHSKLYPTQKFISYPQ